MSSRHLLAGIASVAVLSAFLVFPARAIIVGTGASDTVGNSTGGISDYVGSLSGGGGGVYLGNGWVLTAAHLSVGSTYTLDGVGYSIVGGSATTVSSGADLTMFQISGTLPSLATLSLGGATPSVGSTLTLVGYGASSNGGASQQTTFSDSGGAVSGYAGAVQGKAMGTVLVSGGDHSQAVGPFTSTDFSSTFQFGSSNSAQATVGDSGGGAFQQVGGTWQFVGLIEAVGVYSGQSLSDAYDGNLTVYVDISQYSTSIQAVMASPVPEPEPVVLLGMAGAAMAAVGWMRRRLRARAV